MKKIALMCVLTCGSSLFAQQLGLNSNYLFNEMNVNPAAAGNKKYIPVQLNFRKQWVSFPDSPTSQTLSAQSRLAKNMGLGAAIVNDVAGPSRHTSLTVNAAYKLRLSKNGFHKLGMGIGLTIGQHIIDNTRLSTYLPDDPSVTAGFNNVMVPDASVGLFYTFKDKGFAGISGKNLVQMDRDLYRFQNPIFNQQVRNYYFIGGYSFDLGKNFKLKTTVLAQMIENNTWQGEGSLMGIYKDRFWIGSSYRNKDAVVFLGGMQFGIFKIGYAYDYTLSAISKYSSGSHEIFLELQLPNTKRSNDDGPGSPWIKRNRIYKQGN